MLSSLFGFVGRLFNFGTRSVSNVFQDEWSGCSRAAYIFSFRKQIEGIAMKLSGKIGISSVQTRYNEKEKCADLYTEDGVVIAKIRIHGECGIPEKVVVYSNLSDDIKELFKPLAERPYMHAEFYSF